MMSQEQNDLITRTGPKDPCGKLMRMYWQPAALVDELQGPRPVKPVKLLGEDLVLFRDEAGRLRPDRAALRASRRRPRVRPAGKWRPALRVPRLAVRRLRPVPGDAGRAEGFPALQGHQAARLSRGREERHPLGVSRRRRAAGVSGDRLFRRARQPHLRVQGPHQLQLAAGARSRHRSVARLVPASLLRGRGYVRRLWQAVSRRVRRHRHADDENPARIRPARSSMSSTPNTACG